MKIYIIQGQTGEYSDHTEWIVEAYASKQAAEEKVKFLEQQLLKLGMKYEEGVYVWERQNISIEKMKTVDPFFQYDYTGTQYVLLETFLKT